MAADEKLEDLSDSDLADEAREREDSYRAALMELARRRDWYGCDQWTDESTMIHLASKRIRQEKMRRPSGAAPVMFRAGYEWAALSIFSVLESILDKPSEDAVELRNAIPAGRDLFRFGDVVKVFDPRRRAALDLIQLLESFVNTDLRGFFSLPKRRSAYNPADDEKQRWTRNRLGVSATTPLLRS